MIFYFAAFSALRSALVLQKRSSSGTRIMQITAAVKPPLYRQNPPWRFGTEVVNPDAALYYTQNYLRHNHAGEAKRLDRFHRVAESAALIKLAGFETCPYELPQLQMVTIHKVITDAPSFYIRS